MKIKNPKMISAFIITMLLVLTFQNCAKLDIKDVSDKRAPSSLGSTDSPAPIDTTNTIPNDPALTPPQPACQTQLIDTLRTVKVLFLIDTSGSNAGKSGTDDGKKWRADVLNTFIASYGSKSNFYYGLATFQGSMATPQIMMDKKSFFTNNLNVVKDGISRFMATPDKDSTPYKPALKLAQQMIADDLATQPESETSYIVVMISDGGATDYNDNSDNIIPDINSIVALAPKQISMNSVFYYGAKKDLSQTKYLENIAKIGQGTFITANSSESLKIDDVLKVPKTICQ
ncbi:MAG: vWA domain-containing protein [Pseudobdellovibrio sp.]